MNDAGLCGYSPDEPRFHSARFLHSDLPEKSCFAFLKREMRTVNKYLPYFNCFVERKREVITR